MATITSKTEHTIDDPKWKLVVATDDKGRPTTVQLFGRGAGESGGYQIDAEQIERMAGYIKQVRDDLAEHTNRLSVCPDHGYYAMYVRHAFQTDCPTCKDEKAAKDASDDEETTPPSPPPSGNGAAAF
jgi:hypothetical protein